jgi:hypothetical protein
MATTASGLEEIVREYYRLLGETLADEHERTAWRARLHHGAEAPPAAPERPLVFKGRSEGGSLVEIRQRPDGDLDVEIDGVPVDRLSDPIDFTVYVDGDRSFPEVVDAPPEALEALAAWVADPAGEPPWEHAHELLGDGLIDRYFGLTDRGRRVVRVLP